MAVKDKIKPLGYTGKWIHGLVVSPPGGGKTVFGGTAPNALFITTDPEGTVSAHALGSTAQELEVEHWDDISDVYRYLRDGGIEERKLEWLIIDNTSEAQNFAMAATMEIARKGKPGLDEFVPTQQDYQRSQNMLLKMVKQFNDLPVNVLWTAWQTSEEDEDGNTFFAPAIHGQKGAIAQTIAGYMNVVAYIQVIEKDGKETRRFWFTHHGPFRGKDRYVALGMKRDDLTVPKMVQIIEAAKRSRTAGKRSTNNTTTKSAKTSRRAATPRRKATNA